MTLLEEPQTLSACSAGSRLSSGVPAAMATMDAHLAHQFKTPQQQHETAKLGMWLFLVTEIMLFGGLFCLYGVLRYSKPEIFAWGHRMLDHQLGMINTMILIASSFTMAVAVRAAQLRQRWWLVAMLCLTFAGGAAFLGIKAVEYDDKIHFGLLPGEHFKPNMKYVAVKSGVTRKQLREMLNTHGPIPRGLRKGDAQHGATLFAATCAACHSTDGGGIPNMGANLRTSRFVAGKSDQDLLAFVQRGRMPTDPETVLKLSMPARGGNPALDDQKLYDIITHIRTLQNGQKIELAEASKPAAVIPVELPHSDNSLGVLAPEGLRKLLPPPRPTMSDFEPPKYQALFFSTYFLITGLHGIHVLVGMGVIAWLAFGAWRGRFTSGHSTPVEIGGLYWHLVDLIWILVFALMYIA